jgi:hypothetical protein
MTGFLLMTITRLLLSQQSKKCKGNFGFERKYEVSNKSCFECRLFVPSVRTVDQN